MELQYFLHYVDDFDNYMNMSLDMYQKSNGTPLTATPGVLAALP